VINRYDATAGGGMFSDVAPTRRINGPQSKLSRPNGMFLRQGNPQTLMVANAVDPPDPTNLPAVLEYTLSSGSDAPTGRIQGAATTLDAPADVAEGVGQFVQNVFVAEPGTNRILVFQHARNNTVSAPPTRVINNAGGAQLDRPVGLGFDPNNSDLYVLNAGTQPGEGSINVYASVDRQPASTVPKPSSSG
jgi:hypothetical protein